MAYILDGITKNFYNILKKCNNNELSWVPSLEALMGYLMESINFIFYSDDMIPDKYLQDEKNYNKSIIDKYKKTPSSIDDLIIKLAGHVKEDEPGIQDSSDDVKNEYKKEYPEKFDWRNHNGDNFISEVKIQALCNSCVSFGVCSTVEAYMRIIDNVPLNSKNDNFIYDLSEQHLFFYNPYHNYKDPDNCDCCCDKGWKNGTQKALKFFKETGVIPFKELIYNPFNPFFRPPIKKLPDNWQNKVVKIKSYSYIFGKKENNYSEIKMHISQKGPLVATMKLYSDFLFYNGGVYSQTEFTKEDNFSVGYHCISCIGYDDNKQAWLCKNSWGKIWGEQGYFWIKYGDCEIDDLMWYIDGIIKPEYK